ncbi:MAG: 4-alpha-glucanotransferase [Nocardioidaceae bacterium]
MSTSGQRGFEADGWGIHRRWIDANKQARTVPPGTVQRLRSVIGQPAADLEARAPIVTRPGRELGLGRVEIHCEDGTTRRIDGALPGDFPLGYHDLATADGKTRRLIVSPGRCWLPQGWRAWGWAVQLYAARSAASWGIGDLADLRAMREWAASQGAGFLLLNPLNAVAPTLPQQDSPYLPATRRYHNPLYLRVEDVPGFGRADLGKLAARGRALNGKDLIDRDAAWWLKREALWRIFLARAERGGDFEAWRKGQGRALRDFAVWSALAERHGPDWREWDSRFQLPNAPAVAEYAANQQPLVTFHAWLQWLLHVQLRGAAGSLTVLQDLPIGVDAGGVDGWIWQRSLAAEVTVGAPPDIFNAAGQTWGSPPLIPWRLRESNYEPFIESIRATMTAGGIRIDHVMGLFRLWWVPAGEPASGGAYVSYPHQDLLDILALESHRAEAVVVGEDLGTVERGVREAMRAHAVLSYRLLWFETDDPADWPVDALAAVTTHDLPTVAGLWTGTDLKEQIAYTTDSFGAGSEQLVHARESLLSRLRACTGLPQSAAAPEAVQGVYKALTRAPSTLVLATLEDAIGVVRRPNMPGATHRPNWRLPLPVLVEELAGDRGAADVARVLQAAALRHRG